MARGAAHHHELGAAPLREDVRAGEREGGRDPPVAPEDLPLGARRGTRGVPPPGRAHRAGPPPEAQAARSRTRSSSPRSRSAPAGGCASSSPGARPSPARSRSSSARSGSRSARATASPRPRPVITAQPAGLDQAGHGGAAPRGGRGEDRRRRRDPDPRAPRHEGLLQEARGHRRGDRRGRLVPHRRHRRPGQGRLPGHHRPQEGHPRHLGRQEHRPPAHREPPEDEQVLRGGRDDRQQAELPGRPRGARTSRPSRSGPRRRASPRGAGRSW